MDLTTYLLSKKYTDQTVIGAGAIKGASCEIKSIEPAEGGNNVVFEWQYADGSKGEKTLFVRNGTNGQDGNTPTIGENGHWFIGGVDTGVLAEPELEGYYSENNFVPLTADEIDMLCASEVITNDK